MTDNNDEQVNKKTLTLKRPTLETSVVKQNFRAGRAKSVVVETKRRKILRPESQEGNNGEIKTITKPRIAPKKKLKIDENVTSSSSKNEQNLQGKLSNKEMDARLKALQEANFQAERERIQKEKEEQERKILEERLKIEEAERQKEILKQKEEAAKEEILDLKKEEVEKSPVSKNETEPSEKTENTKLRFASSSRKPLLSAEDEDDKQSKNFRRNNNSRIEARPAKSTRNTEEKRRNKFSVHSNFDDEGQARGRSIAAMRRRQEKIKRSQTQEVREKISREVVIPETLSIQELSQRMTERAVDVIKYLMAQGQMMKPSDVIDADMAQLIAEEFGHSVKRISESDVEGNLFTREDDPEKMKDRSPVVTIMGHVDHGKTSLLDAIRKENVASYEAGGITQHIGAYQVKHNDKQITFIDTPGHAAFTAMRSRGAKVTDIAILVVAADDGVMPQTIESINHAKAANVPIIVAINKIDKPNVDPQRIRSELLQHEIFVESMGGETLDVEVSAKSGKNLDKLLEAILLQAEMLDLKAERDRPAEGAVIEAKLDRGRGSVATVLVQKGTLYPSNIIVAGNEWGRIRALINDRGEHIQKAGPSMPVEILGMQGTPQAGDHFAVVTNEAQAREITAYRQRLAREKAVARHLGSRGSLEQMMNKLQVSGTKEFLLVIKGDAQGSIEAIRSSLEKLGNEEVQARIVHSGAGGITETDIVLAEASQAAIIGFNVRATKQANEAATKQGIEIRYYNIIYDLIDDIKAAMSGLLTPEKRETFIGNAEILEVFSITKVGKVAGCRITEGRIERGANVRLIRDNIVIHEGKLKTLKRFKDEVSEAHAGQECGMAFENYENIRAGDIIEAFFVEQISRSL